MNFKSILRKTMILLLILISAFTAGCVVFPVDSLSPNSTESGTAPQPATPEHSPTPHIPYVFDPNNPDYREAMRQWVADISAFARKRDSDFIVIPQNCAPLFTYSGEPDGDKAYFFLDAISGVGREDLCYGYGGYGIKRPDASRNHEISLLKTAVDYGLSVLSIDYCNDPLQIAFADSVNQENGFLGFFAATVSLNHIPADAPLYENTEDIYTLADAKNFLGVINPGEYDSREQFIAALADTNYDILIIDAVYDRGDPITPADIMTLRYKANGGRRLIISYLSIGEAEDYRDYWQPEWHDNPPDWLLDENPKWPGNFVVAYWNKEWQNIIAFSENSSLTQILDSGFDGVFLDIVDGYENFED